MHGFGFGFSENTHNGTVLNYTDEYKAVLASFTTQPINAVKAAQNEYVKALVDALIWKNGNINWIFAAHTNANGEALKNWIEPAKYIGTPANAPTFNEFEGFTGNGVNADIDLGVKPTTPGILFTKNAATIIVYVRKYARFGGSVLGEPDNSNDTRLVANLSYYCRINSSASFITAANCFGPAFLALRRNDAGNIDFFFNDTKFSAANAVTASLDDYNFHLLSQGTAGWCKEQVSMAFIGEYLTDEQIGTVRTAFQQYMKDVNKNILTFSIIGDSISVYNPDKWTYKVLNVHVEMKNHAVSGQNIMSHMDAQVLATANDNADKILIALGANDVNSTAIATIQAECEENISELKASNPNAQLYWMNVLPQWTSNTGATEVDKSNVRIAIANACTAQGITCIDTYTIPWIIAAQTNDGIHPNDAGNVIIWANLKTAMGL